MLRRRSLHIIGLVPIIGLAISGAVWAQIVVLLVASYSAWPRKQRRVAFAAAAEESEEEKAIAKRRASAAKKCCACGERSKLASHRCDACRSCSGAKDAAPSIAAAVAPPSVRELRRRVSSSSSSSSVALLPELWRAVGSWAPDVRGLARLGATCRTIGSALPAMLAARRERTGFLGRPLVPAMHCHGLCCQALVAARVPAVAPGFIVATASDDRMVKIWSGGVLAGGSSRVAPRCARTLAGHASEVRSLAWLGPLASTSGLLASGSWGEIRVWCLHTAVCLCVLRDGGMQWVNSLAVLAPRRGIREDAVLLLSGSEDRVVRVWRASRASAHGPARVERVAMLEGHSGMVNVAVAVSPALVASGAHDRTVRLWPIVASALLDERSLGAAAAAGVNDCGAASCRVLVGHAAPVRALVALSPARLASGAADHTVRLWCTRTGACIRVLAGSGCAAPAAGLRGVGHARDVVALSVLRRGATTWLLSGSDDGTLRAWDAETGACLAAKQAHRPMHYSETGACVLAGAVKCLAVLDAEDHNGVLVTGGRDGIVKVWG